MKKELTELQKATNCVAQYVKKMSYKESRHFYNIILEQLKVKINGNDKDNSNN